MRRLVCVNKFGKPGGGEFRDKVMEQIVRVVKGVFDAMGISDASDIVIQRTVAALTPTALVCEHDLISAGFPGKMKQHAGDLIGSERREMIRKEVEEVGTFDPARENVWDFLHKARGSPFQGLSLEAILKRQKKNFYRNFPNMKV